MTLERGEDSARAVGGAAATTNTKTMKGDDGWRDDGTDAAAVASGIERFLERAPVPEETFDRSAKLEAVAPARAIGASAAAVYLAVGGVFIFCCAFFAAPSKWVESSFVSMNWREEGYVCRSTATESGMWYTFDECLQNVRPLTTSLIDVSSAATDGVVAFTSFEKQEDRGIIFSFTPEYEVALAQAEVFGGTDDLVRPIDDTLAAFPHLTSDEYGIEELEQGGFVGKCSGSCAANPNATLWKEIFGVFIENLGKTIDDSVKTEADILCDWTKHAEPYICSKSERMNTLDIVAIGGNFASLASAALITTFAFGLRRLYPRSRDDAGNGKQRHLVSKFLLPAELYDERHELPFIAGKRTTFAYSITTIIFKCVALSVLLWYYRQSDQYTRDRRVSVRPLDGYQCAPFKSPYAVNITKSQCSSSVRRPSATSVEFKFSESYGMGVAHYFPIPGMKDFPWEFSSRAVAGANKPAWYSDWPSSTLHVSGLPSWNQDSFPEIVSGWSTTSVLNIGPWTDASKAQALEAWNTLFDESGGTEKVCDRYFRESAPYECIEEQTTHSLYFAVSLAYGLYEILSISWSFVGVLVLSLWRSMHRGDEVQPERCWKSRIPLPQQFYRQNVMNFIASPIRVLSAHVFILAGVVAVFATSVPLVDDAMKRSQVRVISSDASDYAKYTSQGYRCRVVHVQYRYAAPYANWDTRDCMERVRPPSVSNSGFDHLRVSNSTGYSEYGPITPGTYTSIGDVRFHPYGDDVSSFGTAEMLTEDDEPSPIFDSFRAFMDDLKAEFNTDTIQLVGPEERNGIYVTYVNEPDQQRDKVMDAFTRIYEALGAERLCWFISQSQDGFACEKETKESLFAVWSQAWANAALVWLLLLKIIPTLIRDVSYVERIASERELNAPC